MSTAIAVDIGGTKMAAGVVDSDGRVQHSDRAQTPQSDDPGGLWAALAALVTAVRGRADEPIGIGVGCGGPMQWPAGVLSPLNIPAWRGFPLRARLQEWSGLPVRLHNDAICVAVAEHWRGAGR